MRWMVYFLLGSHYRHCYRSNCRIGPEALAAALTALGTMVGGPAGTIAGILVSAVGAAYLANLALQITRAVATGKGICLTIAIPPGVSVQ